MGRPREHDEATRLALLEAAERLAEAGGPDAVGVRAVADAAGTTTRGVYSLFGSKDGLLDALAQRSYELLAERLGDLPATDDPAADLADAALQVFRPMAIGHPSLFRLGFLRIVPELRVGAGTRKAAAEAFELLCARFERLDRGGRTARECAVAFNALCEGLATTELRVRGLLGPDPEAAWRDAFSVLLSGFSAAASGTRPARRTSGAARTRPGRRTAPGRSGR